MALRPGSMLRGPGCPNPAIEEAEQPSAAWLHSSAIFEVLIVPTRVPEATPEETIRAQFLSQVRVLGEHACPTRCAVDVRLPLSGHHLPLTSR